MDTSVVTFSPSQQRALSLLTSGCTPEQTALALGITPSAISQMVSDEVFAGKLAELKFDALRKHNARDEELDALEDGIIAGLKATQGLILDPMKLVRMLAIVNAAKRRGASAPEQIVQKQTILKLNMPQTLIQNFTVNSNNQVVSTGTQELVTIQSSRVKELVKQNGHETSPRLIEASPSTSSA